MDWRVRMSELPVEQKHLLEGGGLSKSFSKLSLTYSHPAFIGAFYGLLISTALLVPMGYSFEWELSEWLRAWSYLALSMMLILAVLAHLSLFVSKFSKRPPVALRRSLLYPIPFIGLVILTMSRVTDLPLSLPETMVEWPFRIGGLLLLAPGPIYVHFSWAPRWRMLTRLEQGKDPFDGPKPIPHRAAVDAVDSEMLDAIEDFEDEVAVLNGNGGDDSDKTDIAAG